MSFVETPFGLLPSKENFIIGSPFNEGQFEKIRSYYSNSRFLEILKKNQPSLYEEYLFFVTMTGENLYKKLLETLSLDIPYISFIKEHILEPKLGDIDCHSLGIVNIDDLPSLYKVTKNDKAYPYTDNIIKQLSNIVNQLPIAIESYGLSSYESFLFSRPKSMEELKNFRGKSLDNSIKKLLEEALYMMKDTITKYCDGKINENPLPFLVSALNVSATMSKQYSYSVPNSMGDKKMICDLFERYSKNVKYIYVKDIEYLSDKNNILSVLLSPSLFKKIEPFVEELSKQIRTFLETPFAKNIIEYTNRQGEIKNFKIIDIDSPEKIEFLTIINNYVKEFFISLLKSLTKDEMEEFLLETTIFDEYNEERISLMKNMRKLIDLIIKEYQQEYRMRDRTLILPSLSPRNKSYRKVIEKGTILYRGYKKTYKNPINIHNPFSFFSLNPMYLSTYSLPESNTPDTPNINKLGEYLEHIGGIAVYRLKKDIEVMDFSNFSSIMYMKKILEDENAPGYVVRAFESSWKTYQDQQTFIRSSDITQDLIFIRWLCGKGYGGYIGMELEEMHDEVAICFPKMGEDEEGDIYDTEDTLDYIGTIDPETYMNFPVIEEPYISYPLLNLVNPIPML